MDNISFILQNILFYLSEGIFYPNFKHFSNQILASLVLININLLRKKMCQKHLKIYMLPFSSLTPDDTLMFWFNCLKISTKQIYYIFTSNRIYVNINISDNMYIHTFSNLQET